MKIQNNSQNLTLYLLSCVLAFSSILYELTVAQTLVNLADNVVIWYSLTIGLYIGSMGVGAMFCSRVFKQGAWRSLFRVECFLTLIGCFSVMIIHLAHMVMMNLWSQTHYAFSMIIFYGTAVAVIICIGLLTGFELPLLIRICNQIKSEDNAINRLLASDYFGSLLGALMFSLILLPRFDIFSMSLFVATTNLAAAMFIFVSIRDVEVRIKWGLPDMIALVLTISLLCVGMKHINTYFINKYYYYDQSLGSMKAFLLPIADTQPVQRFKSPYQTIDFVKYDQRDDLFTKITKAYKNSNKETLNETENLILFMNGSFQFWSAFEELYHEYFAHLPIIINRQVPKNVLVLGAGDGLLIRELIKYPHIEHITLVDIDKKIVQLARTHKQLRVINENALDDPRITFIYQDAFQFVRHNQQNYDAIFMDFPDPKDYDLSKLYSVEFYQMAQELLNINGFIVLDAPQNGIFARDAINQTMGQEIETLEVYYNTLKKAGFKTIIPFFTSLEIENVEAEKIVSSHIGNMQSLIVKESDFKGETVQKIVGREAIIQRILKDFTESHQHRFFMVTNKEISTKYRYYDYVGGLSILNKERFHLALSLHWDYDKEGEKKVNSIMKPILPNPEYWWKPKMPF